MESRPGDLFQPGDLLNNTYRVESLLGRGGTSDVYRARSEISGRLVAVKVLKSEFSGNEDYLVLLTREEEIREIRHDAVVRYSENHRTPDGHVYLLMDYVDGPGLDKKLQQGPMPPEDLMVICRRVAEGLQAAHDRSIVHRDLSPDNIILRGGDPAQAVIIDFGIAKDTNPGAETIVGNEFAGKYAYAAPEQLSGKTDARTDIYSLGALLLANFRGAKPDIGKNPMEVVQKKAEPLDTSGVPEPLKALLDKMTAPNPDDRFQTMGEVLAALDGAPATPAEDDLSDATIVVAPPSKKESDEGPKTTAAALSGDAPDKSGSKTGLIAATIVGVLLIGSGGAYFAGAFDGLLGPAYPPVSPYTLVVEQVEEGVPRAVGHAPNPDFQTSLSDLIARQSGESALTLASGELADNWPQGVMAILDAAQSLDSWRLDVRDNEVVLTGSTSDPALLEAAKNAVSSGLPAGMVGSAQIELIPLFLSADAIEPLLSQFADCGPLTLVDAPATGYGPESAVVVQGTLASAEGRAALFDALRGVAGERKVTLDAEVLNPSLCLIENYLPQAPTSPIDIDFAFGDDNNKPNPSGRFLVGENPVIDVMLPNSVTDGYLSVSVLDVSGNVFHLLPNLTRQDNSVATLRDGAEGDVRVRVAYSLDESQDTGGLAFRVDDTTLGKSKVIAIHSSEPLFSALRPTTESATGYAEALSEQERDQQTAVYSLDSRILTTAEQ